MSEANTGRAIGWEDEIENDGTQWVLLPEGDIVSRWNPLKERIIRVPESFRHVLKQFCISESTRRRAVVPLRIIVLFTTMEWKLSEFFRSIGQKQHGEKLRMNWSAVPGAAGQCKIGIHKFTQKRRYRGRIKRDCKIL